MSNKLVIYSKENCSYCTKAKNFLNELNINYEEIKLNIGKEDDIIIIKNLKETYNHNTFPFILIKGESDVFIGGFNELQTAYNTMYIHKFVVINDQDCEF